MQRSTKLEDNTLERWLWRFAVEASGDIVYSWDLATDRICWGGDPDSFFSVAGESLPMTGEGFHARISPEDLPHRLRSVSDHLSGTGDHDCEFRLRSGSGEFQWVHDRGAVERAPGGVPLRVYGTLRRITKRKQHEARLEYLANFDDLTGHFNKLRLREALDHALDDAQRCRRTGAFLVVGLDAMDRINTAYGYEAGDTVLIEVGRRLDQSLRSADVIGRLGGDRFGIVLGGCSEEEAHLAADRILTTVRRRAVHTEIGELHASVSAGVVVFPVQCTTSLDVMTKAENALLSAKTSGRDCVVFYRMSEEQRRGFRASMVVGEQVKQALKNDRLQLAYQPIVDARTHEVQFYECLVRMRDGQGDLLPAARFIPVVEQLGLMRAVDRHVLDLALDDLARHPEISLAVNISGLTSADHAWLRALVGRLRGKPEVARRLIVEITETAALQDIEDTARFVATVRELGCRVAIDDFGAGYTTFRHLKSLTVDIVKIDGSFVRAVQESPENQLFIRNLLSLAQAFDLQTVGECVETPAEAGFLAGEGLDLLQGYLFGKPEMEPGWRDKAAHCAAKPIGRPTSRLAAVGPARVAV